MNKSGIKIQNGPVTWRVKDEEAYKGGEMSDLCFDSFLGKTEEELRAEDFIIKANEDLFYIQRNEHNKPALGYTEKYTGANKVPFEAYYKPDNLFIWYDPMRKQFITTFDRYDITFYNKAYKIFKGTDDLAAGFETLSSKLNEEDVDRYYLLVEQASDGKYVITIGRHKDKPKKEKKYRFFANSVKEFFEKVVKYLDIFMMQNVSKEVYIQEKEDKRTQEELEKD